mgnify:CR=1 FL=1
MNPKIEAVLKLEGYVCPKQLDDGRVIALMQFIFTVGLVVDIDERGNYAYRYCYEKASEALSALCEWDGRGDPPGNWLKKKGRGVDERNPRLLKGIPIVVEGASRGA